MRRLPLRIGPLPHPRPTCSRVLALVFSLKGSKCIDLRLLFRIGPLPRPRLAQPVQQGFGLGNRAIFFFHVHRIHSQAAMIEIVRAHHLSAFASMRSGLSSDNSTSRPREPGVVKLCTVPCQNSNGSLSSHGTSCDTRE